MAGLVNKVVVLLFGLSLNALPAYNLYYGDLHSHTSYSDGVGVPRYAFAFARDSAGIDVLAITDHGELLDTSEWNDTKTQADSATVPGIFVGIAGFEWTDWNYGHVNVLGTQDFASTFICPTLESLYHWLASRPEGIGQFNHPAPWCFDTFRYQAIGDAGIALCEMHDNLQSYCYHIALDSGWHVGMAAGQDNHWWNWGLGWQTTGIWAESLSRSSILSALRKMRTYGTLDRNLAFRFTANDSEMGSTIANGDIRFWLAAYDPDSADCIRRMEVITNRNEVLDSVVFAADTHHVEWRTTTHTGSSERRYFFAKVTLDDTGVYALSSPVWTEPGTDLESRGQPEAVSDLAVRPNPFTSFTVVAPVPGAPGEPGRLWIFSAAGRRLRSFRAGQTVVWDGRDEAGRTTPAGVYVLVLELGGRRVERKLVRLPKL
jgi:hypothetical protein